MVSDHRCFFCLTRAFEKLLENGNISNEARNSFTRDLVTMFAEKWDSMINPEFARELHIILKKYTHEPDPYKSEKRKNNDQAISLLPELKFIIAQATDPFNTALRLSIAGNIIDFAANDRFDLQATIESALISEMGIDHSEALREKILNAKSILYLGDNAGEIVLDKLFITTINHPDITYVVRGAPVINDATIEDAEYVGMLEIAKVVANGYDAPSTIPGKSSLEFQQLFKKADLIISKGQGNLEGLFSTDDDRIFFLLMVKCDVIAEFLKVKKNSLVVYNSSFKNS